MKEHFRWFIQGGDGVIHRDNKEYGNSVLAISAMKNYLLQLPSTQLYNIYIHRCNYLGKVISVTTL